LVRTLTLIIRATLIVGFAFVGTAQADDLSVDSSEQKAEEFPLSASASIGYRFGHANFIESNGDFGSQSLSVSPSIGYRVTKKISMGLSVGASKALDTSYFYSGTASKNVKAPWEISDVSLSTSFSKIYKIPVVNITINGGLGLSAPLSKTSRAAGRILAISPALAFKWKMGDFSAGVGVGYGYYWNQSATYQVNCGLYPEVCAKQYLGNPETGIANPLHGYSTNLSLGYSLKPFSFGLSYGFSNGASAVAGVDDEFTVDDAQVGTQWGLGSQSFSASIGYNIFEKVNLGFNYRAGGGLYTSDNERYRLPFFDFESQLRNRVSYGVSLSASL
jgi:hypothetical protein